MIFETNKVLVPHWSSVIYEFQRQLLSWNFLVLSSPEIVHSWEANPNNNERRKK